MRVSIGRVLMRSLVKGPLLAVGILLAGAPVMAADWVDIDPENQPLSKSTLSLNAKASQARYLLGDIDSIRAKLLSGSSFVDLVIPLPDGTTATYRLTEYDFAEPNFLLANPQIRAFKGVDVDNSSNKGSFDITPKGFHGMFTHNDERVLIDPEYQHSSGQYMAYYAKDAIALSARSGDSVVGERHDHAEHSALEQAVLERSGSSDGILRTYSIAIAATGEYTAFHGGSVADARAAIATLLVRVNEVYESELGIRLQLVANNDSIIYTDAATDPYANNSTDLQANVNNINAVIGFANYDIGHLVGTGAGGVAGLGVVCGTNKAAGLTGLPSPTGDRFFIEFVAHEIGHQFDADHTFNGTTNFCGSANQRSAGGLSSYEPGSGSTIMAYAGICGVENIQSGSDDYFHARSIEQISNFVTTGGGSSCDAPVVLANNVPVATAAADFAIPANTPFTLNGSATDADAGDTLTYVWEQFDAGSNVGDATTLTSLSLDNGTRPLFRSFLPVVATDRSDMQRTLPQLSTIVSGNTVTSGGFPIAETIPTTTRTMNFRLTVRDGNGGTAFDETVVSVQDTGAAFAVSSPSVGDILSSSTLNAVQWNVAGTNQAPINCSQVDILLSTDGGSSFPATLATAVANDGSADVAMPAIDSSQSRVMVRCSENTFFAISPSDFQLFASTVAVTAVGNESVTEGQSLVFTVTLGAASSAVEQLPFVLTNITADSSDYSAPVFSDGVTSSGSAVSIPAGVSSFSITLATTDDSSSESDETFTINVGGVAATGTINDNDGSTVTTTPSSGGGGGGGSIGFVEAAGLSLLLALVMFLNYRQSLLSRARVMRAVK